MRSALAVAFPLAVAATLVAAPVASPASAQVTRALIVVGLGGTDEYRRDFGAWASELHEALTERYGLSEKDVVVLSERPDELPGVARARSTLEEVRSTLSSLAQASGAEDRILVVLIGHGTAQGDDARFNLPGPDLSASEMSLALTPFTTQTVAIVHTGSAGGGFVAPLAGPRRVVLSATRTARERNATEFARYFVESLSGNGADLDKDGGVSLLEAFTYTRAEVARHYAEQNELLTEHAVLEDDGDGSASPDPGPTASDGRLADAFRFRASAVAESRVTDDPVLARLYGERQEIQERIDGLRAHRANMTQERYDEALEALLVELALKIREIRAREGGGT